MDYGSMESQRVDMTECLSVHCLVSKMLVAQYAQLFGTPWTVARQAPLSMEFFRQEYWSG